jgi:hypothetical protein
MFGKEVKNEKSGRPMGFGRKIKGLFGRYWFTKSYKPPKTLAFLGFPLPSD